MSVNSCHFIGRLGRDPEIKYLDSGTAICNFSIAVDGRKKDDKPEWVRVVAFNKLAEICGEYLTKGKQVYIEGRMQTRTWEKDGETKYSTEIICNQMRMLGGKSEIPVPDQAPYDPSKGPMRPAPEPTNDNDVPF